MSIEVVYVKIYHDISIIVHLILFCSLFHNLGVEIVSTYVDATTGDILEGTQQTVGLRVTLDSDSNGGSVKGNNLWQITAFLNSSTGVRLEQTTLNLTGYQAGKDITAGHPAQISGITFPLHLEGGPATCSDFDYVCIEIAQSGNPSPPFSLDSQPADLIGCDMVNCRGSFGSLHSI